MFNFNFLMHGASYVKANRSVVQSAAAVLADETAICSSVKSQLRAMASAKQGSCNTGLSEAGWQPLAEVIGMVSPRSTKLYDSSPENKRLIMQNFLQTGSYPSTRKDKKGGSSADYTAKAVQEQAIAGVRSQSANARILQEDVRFIEKPLSLKQAMELAMNAVKGLENKPVPVVKPASNDKKEWEEIEAKQKAMDIMMEINYGVIPDGGAPNTSGKRKSAKG